MYHCTLFVVAAALFELLHHALLVSYMDFYMVNFVKYK